MKLNYTISRCSETTARLAIESRSGLNPLIKNEIRRFNPGSWTVLSSLDESVIGRSEGRTCAMVFQIRQNDVIGTREVMHSGEAVWSYYRIDSEFRPVPLLGETRSPNQVDRDFLLAVNQPDPIPNILEEMEIRLFFSKQHPDWLQEIVDRQISQWRESNPDRFFRFAPRALEERSLEMCVAEAPFAALARFKVLLNSSQIRQCVIRSPRGAVIHALEHVTGQMRVTYLIEHGSDALVYSAGKLSDDELRNCAWIDVETGYLIRKRLPLHREAIALASSYSFNFLKTGSEMEEIHREITESIAAFPDQWEASEREGFPAVFRNLENKIGWRFDALLFAEILRRKSDTDKSGTLERFLAGMI